MVFLGETLRQLSVDPLAESTRLSLLDETERAQVFRQNLEAYANEVVADKPVSILYHYYLSDQGDIYTDPSQRPVFNLDLQLDRRERGGLAKAGIKAAVNLALDHPGHMVGLYSPPGPAGFDDDPDNPYTKINYNYGQLYLMKTAGDRIDAVAVKVSDEGERWVSELLLHVYQQAFEKKHRHELIASFIQNPGLIPQRGLSTSTESDDNPIIYQGRDRIFRINEVLQQIRDTFDGRVSPTVNTFDRSLRSLQDFEVTKEAILRSYLSVIKNYLHSHGLQSIELMGSCGGEVSPGLLEIEQILGIQHTPFDNLFAKFLSGLSTDYRELIEKTANDETYDFHDGTCAKCQRQTRVGPCNICLSCE